MRMDDTLRLVAIGILIYEGLEQNGEGSLRLENGQLNVDADLCDENLETAIKLCSVIDPGMAKVRFEYLESDSDENV